MPNNRESDHTEAGFAQVAHFGHKHALRRKSSGTRSSAAWFITTLLHQQSTERWPAFAGAQ
jgi:hypothetical protein